MILVVARSRRVAARLLQCLRDVPDRRGRPAGRFLWKRNWRSCATGTVRSTSVPTGWRKQCQRSRNT